MDFGSITIYVSIYLMQVLLESDHLQTILLCVMESSVVGLLTQYGYTNYFSSKRVKQSHYRPGVPQSVPGS